MQRMESAGAYLTTSESVIFMLLQSSNHPNFRAVAGLIKEHGKLENPFNTALLTAGTSTD